MTRGISRKPKTVPGQTVFLPLRKPALLEWEERLWREGYRAVAGIDEAGRGAWAGPVVAAAVILKPHDPAIPAVDDSKKLTPKIREELFTAIKDRALAFGIGCMAHDVIDAVNILEATRLAMRQAIEGLKIRPDYLLIDGNCGLAVAIPQKPLVGGDGRSASIAAASILAKVTRDRLMREMEASYPQFRFSVHKGYGTEQHRHEIKTHGLLQIHRRSYRPISGMLASS